MGFNYTQEDTASPTDNYDTNQYDASSEQDVWPYEQDDDYYLKQ